MKLFQLVLLAAVIIPLNSIAQKEFSLEEKVKSVLRGAVPLVSTQDVHSWSNAVVLDAREKEEFDISHLPEAKFVGDKKFSLSNVSSFSKKDTIVVYCTVGYRSEGVGEKLLAAGYENVFNLFGGIFSWKNGGGKLIDSQGKETERVHTYNKAWSIFLLEGEKVY